MPPTSDDISQRTYEPTTLRVQEARQRGQVAVSSDLTAGIVLLSAGVILTVLMPRLIGSITAMLEDSLTSLSVAGEVSDVSPNYKPLWNTFFIFAMMVVLVGAVVGVVQTRGLWAPKALRMDWSRLSPSRGFGRIFSNGGWAKLPMGLLKVAAVVITVVVVIRINMPRMETLYTASAGGMLQAASSMLGDMMFVVGVVLTAVGVVDWVLVRWRYRKSLMMTRREYLEDLKRSESQARGRIKNYRNKS